MRRIVPRLLGQAERPNRLWFAATVLLLLLPAMPALADEPCRTPHHRLAISHDSFYECILREIERLKERQRALERIAADYERLKAEIPVAYVNDNGVVSVEAGRIVGQATFVLTARRTGKPASLLLDQGVVEALCSGRRRCRLSLSLRRPASLTGDGASGEVSGPCLFDYDPETGRWVRGSGCLGGQATGIDGNGVERVPGAGAEIVAQAGAGCLLADADVRTFAAPEEEIFRRDHDRGLFLIAAPSLVGDPTGRFTCDLQVD